ncbi:hypothetical protein [Niveispirillum sp.]|uniref:hypothetical protein n=1 Tax=Niveispirillum sp. TaxID=1917217 RepID=UPI001B50245A|nr:hypothetical protein [Niveispirillum sp.]MBP7335163.1 hypothetical protein [Niveispirillum sp.]
MLLQPFHELAALPAPEILRARLKGAEEAETRTLEALLSLSDTDRALNWFPSGAGLLVVSAAGDQQPSRLHLLEPQTLAFARGAGRAHTLGSLPPYTAWVSAPAVTPAGVLVATAETATIIVGPGLTATPKIRGIPPMAGEAFAATASSGDGRFVVALRQGDRILLATGSGVGPWHIGEPLPPEIKVDRAIDMGAVQGGPGFWLSDGHGVLFWEGQPDTPPVRYVPLPTELGRKIPVNLRARQEEHPLSPLAIRFSAHLPATLFLPVLRKEPALAILPLGGASGQIITLPITDRRAVLLPDPWTGGALLCHGSAVESYAADGQRVWSDQRTDDSNFVTPLVFGENLLFIVARTSVSDQSSGQEAQLVIWQRKRNSRSELSVRRPLAGQIARAFPPLVIDRKLVFATRDGSGMRVRLVDLPGEASTEGAA